MHSDNINDSRICIKKYYLVQILCALSVHPTWMGPEEDDIAAKECVCEFLCLISSYWCWQKNLFLQFLSVKKIF